MKKENRKLKEEIERLVEENLDLQSKLKNLLDSVTGKNRKKIGDSETCSTVSVPDAFRPVFLKAQEYVSNYFGHRVENPQEGTIDIHNERYILVRAASMSKEFFETIYAHYQDRGPDDARKVATGFLFDLAHSLGKADARSFHSKMKVTEPIEKLSAGPIHFAYTGWAFVKIHPESNPTPDDNYFLIYDHPFSFEADIWMKEKMKTDFPVCIMNSGYSSGWCEESFGIPLVAVELECRAKGDKNCRFIMAPPNKIESYIKNYQTHPYSRSFEKSHIEIPEFFQRKRLEDELRRSEETARALLNAPTESALLLDIDGRIIALNKTAAERLEKPEHELIGSYIFDLFGEDLRKKRLEYHRLAVKNRMPVQYVDQRKKFWLDNRIFPVLDSSGNVMAIAVYSRDITELKNIELELRQHRSHLEELVSERTEELRRSNQMLTREIVERKRIEANLQEEKERLAVTLASIAEGLVVTDTNGRILTFNQAAEILTGWKQKDALSRSIDEIFPIKKGPGLESSVSGLLSYGNQDESRIRLDEGIFIDRNNHKKVVNFSASAIRDRKNKVFGLIFVFRDITEIKRVEEELLRHRKIESVGLLAGGIAHDFNNLLTGIMGNVSILKHSSKSDSFEYQRLDSCEKACINAKKLTSQLLTFSRGGEPVKKRVRVKKFLSDSINIALSGSSVAANFSLPDDLWAMEIDEGLMSQAISNLVDNSVQAMPDGGNIHVTAENFVDRETVFSGTPRQVVKIMIRDEGQGIPDDVISKIFDPYYTTKAGGTGLGLATAYSIIKKHTGEIRVESTPGQGTTVIILLPAIPETAPRAVPESGAERERSRPARILLMDDEDFILDVGKEILQFLGYDVEMAKTGEEAIEKYKAGLRDEKPFGAVIMDLTIPGGMGGKEAVQVLIRLDPQARVIVSSGYSNDPIMSDFKNYGFSGVVAKPYRIEEIKNALKEIRGD
jgi:PAS domain S-box-containing protein